MSFPFPFPATPYSSAETETGNLSRSTHDSV